MSDVVMQIDGKEVTAGSQMTVLQAARAVFLWPGVKLKRRGLPSAVSSDASAAFMTTPVS